MINSTNNKSFLEQEKLLSYKGRKSGRPLSKAKNEVLNKILKTNSVTADKINSNFFFNRSYYPLSLEIGSGSGEFIVSEAIKNPNKGFFAVEQYINGIASLSSKINQKNINNIKFFPGDVTKILYLLPQNIFDCIYLLFPDPWPKKKHHKRRIIQKEIIDIFSKLLINNGILWFVSDDKDYCRHTLLHFQKHPSFKWTAQRREDWLLKPKTWVDTRYEIKAKKRGISPIFLKFIKSKPL